MADSPQIYVVDDDPDLLSALVDMLDASGLRVSGYKAGRDMLRDLDPEWDGVILSDLRMPEISGLELMKEARRIAPEVPFVLQSAYGDVRTAVSAIREGAVDFVEKTTSPDYLVALLRKALDQRRIQLENRRLRQRIARGTDLRARLLGRSEPMKELRREILAVAPYDTDVLLCGEMGTGKERTARCIHDLSGAKGELVVVKCDVLTNANFDDLLLARDPAQPGALIRGTGGTVYLDKVEMLSVDLQTRLYRLFSARNGGDRYRIVGAINGTPEALAQPLQEDLYYQLSVAEIHLPPLRERGDDFFLLFEHFIRDSVARYSRRFPDVPAAELRRLRAYHWPGNLRELANVCEKLAIGLKVQLRHDPNMAIDALDYDSAMKDFETSLLRSALQRTDGHKTEAAELLRIPRKRLYLRLKACGLG